jgi:DNA repair photolyase
VIEERCFSLLRANDSAAARGSLAANVYRGCSIGCLGCPAASQTVYAKTNATERLREELRQPRYQVRPLQIGSTADAYQPIERERRLTRGLLELLHDCGHPVILVTRSPGVLRDLDLLMPMAQENRLRLAISLCSLDEALSARLEPRAAPPAQRLATIRRLSKAGIPIGLHFGPILPGLTEDGAEALFEAAARAGACSLQCSFVGECAVPIEGCAPWPDPLAWQRGCDERLRAIAQRFNLSLQLPSLATSHFRPPPRREAQVGVAAPSAAPGPNGQACLF